MFYKLFTTLCLPHGKALNSFKSCSDAEVKLDLKHSDVSAAFRKIESKLTPDLQQRIQTYLTTARLMDYKLSDEMQKVRI